MQNTKTKKPGKSEGSNGNTKNAKAPTQEMNSQLQKFFEDSLKDIYWAEKNLIKALPKMQKAATTGELKNAIEEHLTQTENQVARLEQVFELIGKKAQAKKCDAMEGLIKEGESIVEETEEGSMTRDVGIIMAAQKIEHYEIATYGGLVQIATTMGLDEAADLLNETLDEEKETEKLLSGIAESKTNWEAEQETKNE